MSRGRRKSKTLVHTLSADYSGVRQGVELIRSFPDDKGIRGEKDNRMLLMAEESMGDLLNREV